MDFGSLTGFLTNLLFVMAAVFILVIGLGALVLIYFRVSDIAQSYEMLIARGVEFTSAPAQLDDFWSRNR